VTAKNPANNNNSSIAAATFISIKGVFCFGGIFLFCFLGVENRGSAVVKSSNFRTPLGRRGPKNGGNLLVFKNGMISRDIVRYSNFF